MERQHGAQQAYRERNRLARIKIKSLTTALYLSGHAAFAAFLGALTAQRYSIIDLLINTLV